MSDSRSFLCSVRHQTIVVVILSLSACLNPTLTSDGGPVSSCQTDCSWTSYEAMTRRNEFFQCTVDRQIAYYTCPKIETSGTKTVEDRPDPVEDLGTEFYLLNTTNHNGVSNHQTCLRATFTLDPSTAGNIQAITVSLLSRNYDNYGEILCHNYRFSNNLTYCSVLQGHCNHDRKRIFMNECLCDLIPGGNYVLQVRSFPVDELTETQYDATVRRDISVPDCSVVSLDYHCPKGLSKWEPFYSESRQESDYNSMTTCFSLPPENAQSFHVFLYEYRPHSLTTYSLYKHELVNRGTVDKETRMVSSIQTDLACIHFTDVKTNTTYLPAVRLDDEHEIFMMRYLYQAQLFLQDNPCKIQPCGDIADGVCIANGSSHHCVCHEGTVLTGGRCEKDKQVPEVENCPSDIKVWSEFGKCSTVVNWAPIEAKDNSGHVTIEQTHSQKQSFPVGNTSVRYTFTDRVNNSVSCVFLVSVIDKEPPVMNPCPQSIVKTVEEGHTHAMVSWEINARDNCKKVNHDFPLVNSGMSFAVGETRVAVKAWDDAGNSVTCNVDVTIYPAPFNYLRLALIAGGLFVVTLIIIGLFWKYRHQLKIFKSIIKSTPYTISVNVNNPASSHGASGVQLANQNCDPGGENSIVGTLSDEWASQTHSKFVPVPLAEGGPQDAAERLRLVEKYLEDVASHNSQESDSLVDSHSSPSERNSSEGEMSV